MGRSSRQSASPGSSPLVKWLFPRVLEDVQLAKLSEHKYSSTSASFLDPFMQHYWNWLVTKLPMWVAPNLITMSGLAVNIVTSVVLMYYAPQAKELAPRWSYFLCGLGLFIYQSLDAIDGKQARRTGTSSPLGEMFDHGCDSVSTVFVSVAACIACRLGMHPNWLFFQVLLAMSLFYCSHWQTYVSGTLKFGKIDVTEAQMGIISIHFISSLMGPEVWDYQVPLVNVPLKFILIATSVVSATLFFYTTFSTIFTGGVGKNGSTVAGTSVLSPFLPIAMVMVPGYVISQKSGSRIFETHPCLYLVTFGLVAAKITNKLVVAHMTKHEMTFMDTAYIGPGLLFLNQYFDYYVPEVYVLWIALLWSLFDLTKYCSQVCLEICDHMGIYLFKITPKPPTTPGAASPPHNRAPALHNNGMPTKRNPSGTSVASSSSSTSYQTVTTTAAGGGGYSSSSSTTSSASVSPSPVQRRTTRTRASNNNSSKM